MADPAVRLPDLRTQVMSFKVAQLQECAGRLGISKSGKKADVQSRLLAFFGIDPTFGSGDVATGTEGKLQNAARVVRDVYCVYKGYGRPSPAASPGIGASPASGTARAPTPAAGSTVVRCLCQRGADPRMPMVQCTEPDCGIWQHERCVAGAVAAAGGASRFRCEQCRVVLADPFWQPLELLLPVATLKTATGVPPIRDPHSGELHPHQHAERAVFLAEPHVSQAKASPSQHRLQVGCLLLEDSVQCRMHWPRNVALKINNIAYRPYGRSATAKMGINQRDEPASVASLCFPGRNTVDIQSVEAGSWLLMLQRARRRNLAEVKSMMAPTESLFEAVARVQRLLHGGADPGDDDAIAVASQVVSLKDPMSGQRMATPARFTGASGLQAFDLDSFLSLAARNRKWQDPTTLKNSTVRAMRVDVYVAAVLAAAVDRPEVTEIEINDEGKWRPEGAGDRCGWFSVEDPVEEVKAALKAWASAERSGGGGRGAVGNGKANGSPGDDGVVLSDSESDEEEELRKAAAAVKAAAAKAAAASGQKRKLPEPETEVIDLCSDSDDEPGPARAAAPAQAANESAAAAPRGPPPPNNTVIPLRSVQHASTALAATAATGAGGGSATIPRPPQPQSQPAASHPSGPRPNSQSQASQPSQLSYPPPGSVTPLAVPAYSNGEPLPHRAEFQAMIAQARWLQSMRGQGPPSGGPGAAPPAPAAAAVAPPPPPPPLLPNGSQGTGSQQIQVSSGTRIVVPPYMMPGAAAARPPAEAMLSESSRAALEAERARLAADPSLMDEVDEWLN